MQKGILIGGVKSEVKNCPLTTHRPAYKSIQLSETRGFLEVALRVAFRATQASASKDASREQTGPRGIKQRKFRRTGIQHPESTLLKLLPHVLPIVMHRLN